MEAGNMTTIINATVITTGEPPPFPAQKRSVDLSPLKFILAILAIITIPALLYALFLAVTCPSSRRRHRSTSDSVDSPRVSTADPVASHPRVSDISETPKTPQEDPAKVGEAECQICFSSLADGREVRRLRCHHSFHSECIAKWLALKSECPICRDPVPSNQVNGSPPSGNTGHIRGGRRVSASNSDEDQHQGLPDASSLV